jgi:putative hydrolase of the HAD superfamily
MQFDTILFDLDDTLYESGNGLWDAIRFRMSEYMHEKLELPWNVIPNLRKLYYETYGTTLRGLQTHYDVDPDDYLAYVHDLPLDVYIKPDPDLHKLLQKLPQSKYIFTNADSNHARRVLNILGVSDCLDGIIDVRALSFYCKPELEAYKLALKLAKVSDAIRCIYLDDAPNNLAPAKEIGIYTIRVGSVEPHPSAYRSIKNIKDLSTEFPELWQ